MEIVRARRLRRHRRPPAGPSQRVDRGRAERAARDRQLRPGRPRPLRQSLPSPRPGTARSMRRWPRRWSISTQSMHRPATMTVLVRSRLARRAAPRSRVGHGLEGDFNRKAHSAPFQAGSASASRRRASPWSMTARSRDRRGSLSIDDEGTPTRETMPDRGRHPQGLYAGPAQRPADGRRAHRQRPPRDPSRHAPMPRMTNTFMKRRQGRSGRAAEPGEEGHLSPKASAAGRSTSCRASSSSPAPRRTGSRNGKLGGADQGRHADRRRPSVLTRASRASATTSHSTRASACAARAGRACRRASASRPSWSKG